MASLLNVVCISTLPSRGPGDSHFWARFHRRHCSFSRVSYQRIAISPTMASSEPPGDAAAATPPAPAAQEQSPVPSPPAQPSAAGEGAGEAAGGAGEAAGGTGEETGLLPPTHWTELAGQVGVISSLVCHFWRAERCGAEIKHSKISTTTTIPHLETRPARQTR